VEFLRAFWMLSANVGDNLNHYILSRLASDMPLFTGIESPHKKLIAIGSILNWCDVNCIAWGPGLATQTDGVNPEAKVVAVRGPRSWQRAKECGLKVPEIFGDPALLLPLIYQPKKSLYNRPTLIPHYVDQDAVFHRYAADVAAGSLSIINVLDAPETIIDQIASAEYVISSSLHGIIIAHAYGIPAAWVTFGGPIGGDGMKYYDHFEAVELNAPGVVDLQDFPDSKTLIGRSEKYFSLKPKINTAPLLKVAPFKLRPGLVHEKRWWQ
jgi:pyruvyltransferase